MAECLITGCALVADMSGASAWGDLHQDGNCYIFNANLKDHETRWSYGTAPDGTVKTLHVFGDYFERRGVIVVQKAHAQLNDAANAYLRGPVPACGLT